MFSYSSPTAMPLVSSFSLSDCEPARSVAIFLQTCTNFEALREESSNCQKIFSLPLPLLKYTTARTIVPLRFEQRVYPHHIYHRHKAAILISA